MAVGFGRGSSLKYLWLSISLAEGRLAGFSERRLSRRDAPALVRVVNLERTTLPEAPRWLLGRRRERALGRRLKPGQVSSVGMPHSSKIYTLVNYKTWNTHLFPSSLCRRLGAGLTLLSWSTSFLPWSRGFLVRSSPNMHPRLHMSTEES
jgi:hypothetical protein